VDAFFQNAAANFIGELACAIVVAVASSLFILFRKKRQSVPRGFVPPAKSGLLEELIAAVPLQKKT